MPEIYDMRGTKLDEAVALALGWTPPERTDLDRIAKRTLPVPSEPGTAQWKQERFDLGPHNWQTFNIVRMQDGSEVSWREFMWRHPEGSYVYLPSWHKYVAEAWELDGEGWSWMFEEDTCMGILHVTVWIPSCGGFAGQVSLLFSDFPSKSEAYATARCLAWLKAKER